ncbi:MAG: hypothetical protein IPM48_11845 [Saprospiraceae bacterium]|nr:hypothetical protein [Saprospiraceae bacterium]
MRKHWIQMVIPLIYMIFWGLNTDCGDMTEIVPAIKQLSNPQLYPKDFYLNFTNQLLWYERSFIVWFLFLTVSWHKILFYLMWYILAVFFLTGLQKLIQYFGIFGINSWMAILIVLFVFPYTAIGGNEIFYPVLSGSIFAKTLVVWAFVFFLRNQIVMTFVLLGISIWFQAIVGAQMGLMFGLVSIGLLAYKKLDYAAFMKGVFSFLILALPCIFLLMWSRLSVHDHSKLFHYLIEFRIGHHFYLQYSSKIDIIIFYFLWIIGLILWRKIDFRVFCFFLIQQIIMILYLLNSFLVNDSVLLQTQWLKTSIWIELFALIGLFLSFKDWIPFRLSPMHLYIGLGVLLATGFWKMDKRYAQSIDEKTLSLWVKEHIEMDALFLIPAGFTCFKSLSERSVWVDYKSVCHQIQYMAAWYDRIQRVYGIGLKDRREGLNLWKMADEFYQNLSIDSLVEICQQHKINYVVLPSSRKNDFDKNQLVFENKLYCIIAFH